MGRAPCCDKASVKRGPWSPEEDAKLKDYIEKQGTGGNWIALPQKAGLNRCGKSCRLRWLNYLRPNIKHGEFSEHEDRIICTLYANIGSRWSIIAAQLPGRTDNDIKNYWNTKLKKKLAAMAGGYYTNPPSSNLFYGGASLAPEQQHSHFSLFSPTIPTPPVPSTSTSDSFYELSPFNSSSSSSATTLQPDKLVSSGINAYVHEAASCSASSVHHCQFDHQQMSDSNLQGFSSPYYGNNEILGGINQETMNYESANPLDCRYYYGIEEIKQLISSNSSSSSSTPSSVATSKNNNSSNSYGSFLLDVDDKSTGGVANLANTSEEGFLYYYY